MTSLRCVALLLVLSWPGSAWAEPYDESYDEGYEYAESYGIEDDTDCESEFSEDEPLQGCLDYVEENRPVSYGRTFYGYRCTFDCSGHLAGWNWAESRGITQRFECGGRSQSFIEGCYAYVDQNH